MDIKWLGYIFQLERIEQNGSRPSALGPHPTSAPPSFRPAPEWILKFDFLNFDCITRIFFNRTHDIILKHTHIWCVWRNIKNHKTPRFWCYKICSLSLSLSLTEHINQVRYEQEPNALRHKHKQVTLERNPLRQKHKQVTLEPNLTHWGRNITKQKHVTLEPNPRRQKHNKTKTRHEGNPRRQKHKQVSLQPNPLMF